MYEPTWVSPGKLASAWAEGAATILTMTGLLSHPGAPPPAVSTPVTPEPAPPAGQARRCGRPGPYAYFTPRPQDRGQARYVPKVLAGVVRRYLRRGEQAEAVLAEISAINAELLARRELT